VVRGQSTVKGSDLKLFDGEDLKYGPSHAPAAHIVPIYAGGSRTICSLHVTDEWRGTGSQDEYETAQRLRACVKCRVGRTK